ncbi:hypothetical protein BDQ17DRAFT_1254144 [Cyathus striatus]|nr:hypothetical protein BDQ17DRAFT_1254144 [Cyathus striatus]
MPSTALPRPVLAVTPDAVRNLQGREAVLPSGYVIFTKCKESLHDGRRLENIAWRLWYRALAQDDEQETIVDEKPDLFFIDKTYDEKKESVYDQVLPPQVVPQTTKKPADELVEKRERDRDYGRTGSWQEREKDRLAAQVCNTSRASCSLCRLSRLVSHRIGSNNFLCFRLLLPCGERRTVTVVLMVVRRMNVCCCIAH